MDKQNLINEIAFTCKLFISIIIFSCVGFVVAYTLHVESITGAKMVIGSAIIGTLRAIYLVIKRIK